MSKSKLRRDADLLLHRGSRADDAYPATRARRPANMQRVIGALGSLMLSDGTPMMEKFVAGKIFHLLQHPGAISSRPATALRLAPQLQFALRQLAQKGKPYAEASDAINDVAKNLDWVSSKTGPFASVNIETAHAHAIIAGASGLEEREDVTLGLTIMEPYSRFPDHVQYRARVFLALSDCEFLCDDRGWQQASPGSTFYNEAGHTVAMRCTSRPLLAAWCQMER